jgi:putative intracellular protease/amidase
MWDFPEDKDIQRIAAAIYDGGGVVAAVCHGPAALVNVKLSNGRFLVAGRNVAAFSNAEEEAAGLTKVMPFLLESTLIERGARYSKAGFWEKHVVVDRRLVTGQNPASAAGVGEAVANLLRK